MFMKKIIFLVLLVLFFSWTNKVSAIVVSVNSSVDGKTKVLVHSQDNLDPDWLTFGYDDSTWSVPYSVWGSGLWSICKSGTIDWLPSSPGDYPPCSYGWRFLKRTANSDPKIIQGNSSSVQGSWTRRDFFRRKFVLPNNIVINRAFLYSASDNLSKYWLNQQGVPVDGSNIPTNSLNNEGQCLNSWHGGTVEGGIWTTEVTNYVKPGNNILAVSNHNWRLCGSSHPMGVQFYLLIDYDILPPTPTPTFTPTPTSTPTPTPTFTPTPTPTFTPTPTPTPTPAPVVWEFEHVFRCPSIDHKVYKTLLINIYASKQGAGASSYTTLNNLNQCGLSSRVLSRYSGDTFMLWLEIQNEVLSPLNFEVVVNRIMPNGQRLGVESTGYPLSHYFAWDRTLPAGRYEVRYTYRGMGALCGPSVITEPVRMCYPGMTDEVDTGYVGSGSLDEARCITYCGGFLGGWVCKNYTTNDYNCSINGFPERFDGNYYCYECPCPGC